MSERIPLVGVSYRTLDSSFKCPILFSGYSRIGGTTSASGDCTLDCGGEIGSSGKSSLNFDIVLFGILEVDRIGVYPTTGPCPFCIESRDKFEKDDGGCVFLAFDILLKYEVQDPNAFELGSACLIGDGSSAGIGVLDSDLIISSVVEYISCFVVSCLDNSII